MKILLADRDQELLAELEGLLQKWGYDVVLARDGAQAWRILEGENAPRLAILEWKMTGLDGIEVCRRWRLKPEAPPMHVLLILDKGGQEDLVEGLNAGADDFLRKPLDLQELKARLRTGSRIAELEEAVHRSEDALRLQATHDPVTGAWNRATILEFLAREFARAGRDQTFVSVLLADLDRLREVNSTYGHRAGDEVLREVVRRMLTLVRSYDSVGRYGGEEFLLVLPMSDGLTALYVAERIREAIAATPIRTSDGTILVTVSLGVAAVGGDEDMDSIALLRAVDLALSRAKSAGRNRCALATKGDLTIETGPPEPGHGPADR